MAPNDYHRTALPGICQPQLPLAFYRSRVHEDLPPQPDSYVLLVDLVDLESGENLGSTVKPIDECTVTFGMCPFNTFEAGDTNCGWLQLPFGTEPFIFKERWEGEYRLKVSEC